MANKKAIVVKLSEDDAKQLSLMVGECGMTVAGLIENFVGDLVDGGSDEHDLVLKWLERNVHDNDTFLNYLIKFDEINQFLENWDAAEESRKTLQRLEEELLEKERWKMITTSDNEPAYDSRQAWEKEQKGWISGEREEVEFLERQYMESWNNYVEWLGIRGKLPGSFSKSLQEIEQWRREYREVDNRDGK